MAGWGGKQRALVANKGKALHGLSMRGACFH